MCATRRFGVLAVGVGLLVSVTGCATIVHGAHQEFGIATDPYQARVYVDGTLAGTTPLALSLSRRHDHALEVLLDGYQPYKTTLKRKPSGWFLANIPGLAILGAPIGMIVDVASGAFWNLDHDHETLVLQRLDVRAPTYGVDAVLIRGADSSRTRLRPSRPW